MLLHSIRCKTQNVFPCSIQSRNIYYKDSNRKAKFRLTLTPDGKMVEPTKIQGYNPDETDKFVRWLRKTGTLVGQEVCFLLREILFCRFELY
jgi:hypothetical protein